MSNCWTRKYTQKKKSSNEILNLLKQTSRVEFKISFPLRQESNNKMSEKWYVMNIFSRLFEIAYTNKKVRKDGLVQEREYFVIFYLVLA